ncbi:MAG: amino acid ABC transporter permease [Proteobacteria bacterium]|nr:amino acid ABC transporter permease [Pseudomonadota bacterium]
MNYELNFFFVWRNLDSLLEGLLLSLELTGLSIIIGLSAGFVLALCRMSPLLILSVPATAFIEFFRCTPMLIQIVWVFYCLPILFDLSISPYASALLALGLNLTAFNGEAYRAAIQAIPRAHLDAGVALGLNHLQRVRHIIFPQAFRAALPVLMTNGVGIFQQSALVSVIAIAELMYKGKMLATQTYRPIETLTTVALLYFIIAFPITQMVKRIEDRMATRIGG